MVTILTMSDCERSSIDLADRQFQVLEQLRQSISRELRQSVHHKRKTGYNEALHGEIRQGFCML